MLLDGLFAQATLREVAKRGLLLERTERIGKPASRSMPRLPNLATGGGFATRELYSDDNEKVFNAARPVLFNGIEELAIAEQAVQHCPGDAYILLMAATAALLERQPERALVFLKQFSKRAKAKAEHLLHAERLGSRTRARPDHGRKIT